METILVTGGTGFLGRQLGINLRDRYNVILTGRNNGQNAAAGHSTGCHVMPLDVANIESVRDVLSEARPKIVIHAAATKYVDLSEKYPMECLDVNVLGSQNIARVAVEKGVQTVIGMSTDKSAPPVANTYGLTKALMERLFCAMSGKTETKFACVRHGNIAWSTGSFLPIWKRMHEESGLIGSTGPDMTRYLSTVDEAVELVTTALDNIQDVEGAVLSREMKAVKIRNVLETWIKHKGGRWEQIDGRPGERPHEYLMGEPELAYTKKVTYNNVSHYLTRFDRLAEEPLTELRCSETAQHLSEGEMLEIIDSPPAGEI
jgi:UDP-N-acetylglucosamine 4,6-dehydratase/5-epimerase